MVWFFFGIVWDLNLSTLSYIPLFLSLNSIFMLTYTFLCVIVDFVGGVWNCLQKNDIN